MLPDFVVLGVDPTTHRLVLRSRHDNSGLRSPPSGPLHRRSRWCGWILFASRVRR
jgi:hypothetical protein